MEELYSRLAPVWDMTLTVSGFKRGLCRYVLKEVSECGITNPKILDVGCGTGLVSFALLKKFPEAHIVATDVNEDMVKETEQIARRKRVTKERLTVGKADVLAQETVTVSGGDKIYLSPGHFDVVIASGVLEYTPLDLAVPKLLSLMKPNGRLIVISVKDNTPVGKLWGKVYKFNHVEENALEKSLIENGCRRVARSPLTFKEFPANVTRTGLLAVK